MTQQCSITKSTRSKKNEVMCGSPSGGSMQGVPMDERAKLTVGSHGWQTCEGSK